jgi:hypothetical protein
MSAATVYTQAATLITASSNSGPLSVGNYVELALDVNLTTKQGTSPTIQFFIDRLGVDGIYYNVWSSSVISTTPTTVSQSIGAGLTLASAFGGTIQFRWSIGGSSTPGYTYSVSLQAK